MKVSLEQIMEISILAGEIMLKNGGETSRVEETMEHIAKACGVVKVATFVIPTGVFLTLTNAEGKTKTTMRRVKNRTINLERIAKVNELSRRLAESRISFDTAYAILERIAKERTGFSLLPSMGAAGVVGAGFAVLQDAALAEVFAAFFAAFLVRYIAHVISRLHGVRFTFEFLGAIAAALFGVLTNKLMPSLSRDVIVLSGIMPLVPGVAITNGIRDIIAGDVLSGLSRGMEAVLTSIAVAMGVVIILTLAA